MPTVWLSLVEASDNDCRFFVLSPNCKTHESKYVEAEDCLLAIHRICRGEIYIKGARGYIWQKVYYCELIT